MAYALAGADCIDVAADPAAIAAAKEALSVAGSLAAEAGKRGYRGDRLSRKESWPLIMASLNDGEDPHFRKAEFNPATCPSDCPRPCEKICPAGAIVFSKNPKQEKNLKETIASREQGWEISTGTSALKDTAGSIGSIVSSGNSGVIEDRCYGCGRCVLVCPIGHIVTRSYVSTPAAVAELVLPGGVDAIEIHTKIGRLEDFKRLWKAIAPWIYEKESSPLKLLAISCGDGEGLTDYLWSLYDLISPLPCPLIWQTDGRPMSGDISPGTTHAAIKLGQKVLDSGPPGRVQLAGGTNNHTASKLAEAGLLNSPSPSMSEKNSHPFIAGIAYGSYARVLLSPILERLEALGNEELKTAPRLEDRPELLWEAVDLANSLVNTLKSALRLQYTTK